MVPGYLHLHWSDYNAEISYSYRTTPVEVICNGHIEMEECDSEGAGELGKAAVAAGLF